MRPKAIAFSEVFDLPRLQRELNMDVLDWKDVKDTNSEEMDLLGCWNVFQVASVHETEPRFTESTMLLKLGKWHHISI